MTAGVVAVIVAGLANTLLGQGWLSLLVIGAGGLGGALIGNLLFPRDA